MKVHAILCLLSRTGGMEIVMKKSFYIYCMILSVILLCLALTPCAYAQNVREYSVTLDEPKSITAANSPIIFKDYEHGTDPVLTLSGWVKTDLTMQRYEYTVDGGRTWVSAPDAVIERADTKHFCPQTWRTAGYRINVDVSLLPRGTYDIFVRGYTTTGEVLELLVLLDAKIGHVDEQSFSYCQINLLALGGQENSLSLPAAQALELDAYSLYKFTRAEILTDAPTTLTLSAADTTDPLYFSLSAMAQETADGYAAEIDLTDIRYAGKLQLSSDADVQISRIRFYYSTPDYYTGDLKIHMTLSAHDYLGGANMVAPELLSDDTVGTYTKLFATDNTNDPFIYFNIANYLNETQNVLISADHYQFAVITLQTPKTNSDGLFRLFLCAGEIRGPSGDSHIAFQPINDGEWHTYVIPLYEENDWTGQIHGMRFDFIDAHATPADYANIASIGFYPDRRSAHDAANEPLEVYHEQGIVPVDKYKEEGRAPSGRADAITWFDDTLAPCFGGENKASFGFNQYGHLMLSATSTTNDPYVSFDMQTYAALTGLPLLRAEENKVIVLRVMADEGIVGKNFVLYYYSAGLNYAEGTRAIGANFQAKGNWEYLIYDMSEEELWTDNILGMRLDFASQINTAQKVCVSDILFFADMDAWHAYADAHGIAPDGSDTPEIGESTTEPETERPTIEIPTEGPGLEYIPSESEQNPDPGAGCKSTLSMGSVAFALLMVMCAFCLVACAPKLPDTQKETESETEQVTETQTSAPTSTEKQTEPTTEHLTDPVTQETTEEETTYGPLHFPEDTGE